MERFNQPFEKKTKQTEKNWEEKLTVPSIVTAAKTVEEYGDQATSPTAAFRSNVNIGVLHRNENEVHHFFI